MQKLSAFLVRHNEFMPAGTQDDWRSARAWLDARVVILKETGLRENKARMEDALSAAKSTFRNDVAVALHEHLEWLSDTINRMNEALRLAPMFTNNERYQFRTHGLQVERARTTDHEVRRVMREVDRQRQFSERRMQVQLPQAGLEAQLELLDELAVAVLEALGPAREHVPLRRVVALEDHLEHRMPTGLRDDRGEQVHLLMGCDQRGSSKRMPRQAMRGRLL